MHNISKHIIRNFLVSLTEPEGKWCSLGMYKIIIHTFVFKMEPFICFITDFPYTCIKRTKINPFTKIQCFNGWVMSGAKDGYATPSLKELREVRSLLKIITTIISKARSVKPTIKWWLRRKWKEDILFKIINELNRKIVYTQNVDGDEEEKFIIEVHLQKIATSSKQDVVHFY